MRVREAGRCRGGEQRLPGSERESYLFIILPKALFDLTLARQTWAASECECFHVRSLNDGKPPLTLTTGWQATRWFRDDAQGVRPSTSCAEPLKLRHVCWRDEAA